MRLQFSFTFTYGALALWESATAPWNIYPERIYIYSWDSRYVGIAVERKIMDE